MKRQRGCCSMILKRNIRDEKRKAINEKYSSMNFFVVILALYLVLFFFRNFVYVPIQVVGRSMMPTLENGDMLVVNKTISIKRGDVIVFADESKNKSFIKRVIGIAGDQIMIKDGIVYRSENGGEFVPLVEDYISSLTFSENSVYSVPQGKLFVLGDNRMNSSDSRLSYIGLPNVSSVLGVVPNWVINYKDYFITKLLMYIL